MLNRKPMLTTILIALAAVVLAGSLFVYVNYRRDIRTAYQQLDDIDRQMVVTACGEMEVAVRGEGPAVLMVHGSAGGFDQSLNLAADHVSEGYRVIAPSRFGYLGTPLPQNATPQTEADALACLLDELSIEQAAVMAYSAGGPSTVQLALHHPERVSALVLVSTAIADKPLALPPPPVIKTITRSDFIFWLLTHPLRGVMQGMFVPGDYDLTPAEDAVVADTMAGLLPINPRAEGLAHDILKTNTDPHENSDAYELETIAAPTLVINAKDDPAANYEDARAMSERIPHSQLVTIEEGGHMMLGSGDRVPDAIGQFLRENAH